MTIDTILYDLEGNLLSGVYAWPKARPQSQYQSFVIGNGELVMSGLLPDDIIVFSFQDKRIELPVSQIGPEIYLDFTTELNETDLGVVNKKNNGYIVVLGFLGLGLISAYVLSSNNTQKVRI